MPGLHPQKGVNQPELKSRVTKTKESITACYYTAYRCLAIASADIVKDHWWVSRVKVDDRAQGQGLGKKVVADLIAAVKEVGGPKRVVVCPGGYGSDPDELSKFYQACGFHEVRSGMLEMNL